MLREESKEWAERRSVFVDGMAQRGKGVDSPQIALQI